MVDDVAVEPPSVCKVEAIAAASLAAGGDRFATLTPACSVALLGSRAEIAATISRRRSDRTYASPAVVKMKTPIPGLDFTDGAKIGGAVT